MVLHHGVVVELHPPLNTYSLILGKVVTVSGIATQGDAVDNKWVTEYTVSYGYDEQSWLDYAGGQVKCHIKDKKTYQ